MKKRYNFYIPGIPFSCFKENDRYHMVSSNYSENRIRYLVTLENQFGDNQIINEPIDINVKFYMPINQTVRKVQLIHLFRFINNIAAGKIYEKESLIHHLTLNKYYVKEPRVEITIRPHLFKE